MCCIECQLGEMPHPALCRPSSAIACLGVSAAVMTAMLCCTSTEAAGAVVLAKPSLSTRQRPGVFWTDFRDAVRTNDRSAIAHMTKFPFVVRWGNADDNDPSISYDRNRFQDELDHLLSLKVAGEDRTMAQVVESTSQILDSDVSSCTFMVGSFEFRLVGGTWRWVSVFTADASFFPANVSSPVPAVSPLRKLLLDVAAEAAHLKRPLKVNHLRSTGELAYLEAQEPGKSGRIVRAFLQRLPDTAQGQMSWEVKHYSFQASR